MILLVCAAGAFCYLRWLRFNRDAARGFYSLYAVGRAIDNCCRSPDFQLHGFGDENAIEVKNYRARCWSEAAAGRKWP